MKTFAQIAFGVNAIAASNLVMADCPRDLPKQLLEDCVVYEGSGSTFPTNDYAYIDEYQKWLKTRQPEKPAAKNPIDSIN